ALDWYDIRIKDAINTANASTVAALCVDQPTTDNPFCDAISRQAGSGYIDSYIVQPENVAAFRTAGLELNAAYQVDTANLGTFDMRLVGGYLHRLEQIPTIGADVQDNRDQPFRPKYNLTFSPSWSLGALTVNYNLRWQNGVRRFERVATDGNPSYVDPQYFRFKELWQHDIRAQYEVGDAFAFYAGVNNFTNQKPDIGFETNVPISPVGRYFYAGAKMTLGSRR
ncbi:TonB-dependent receptor, partial [uncultured Novosphingobium sp.]